MEEQGKPQDQSEDVEAHIRPRSHLQEEDAPTDEQGLRFRNPSKDEDEDDDPRSHGKRF